MGERKVLNKYIPADFDPRLVPRGKKPKDDLVPVRMMLPFSIQCSSCSSFMYRGTKFNSKKEPMGGSEGKYLGIQRYRLYIKCTTCARPITFLTDPKNADYEMEHGGTRNYEVWHDKEKTEEEILMEKETDEKLDPMKALENRVLDSQREMQDLENLDEIKAMNMRHLQMFGMSGIEHLTQHNKTKKIQPNIKNVNHVEDELNENGFTASEEEMIKNIQFGKSSKNHKKILSSSLLASSSNKIIKRIEDDEEYNMELSRKKQAALLELQQTEMMKKPSNSMKHNYNNTPKTITQMPLIKVKRKRQPMILSSNIAAVSETVAPSVKDSETNVQPKKSKTNSASNTIQHNKVHNDTNTNLSKSTSADNDNHSEGGLGGLLGVYGSSSESD